MTYVSGMESKMSQEETHLDDDECKEAGEGQSNEYRIPRDAGTWLHLGQEGMAW